MCSDFGQAANCSASQIIGAIINARQSAFKETMKEICKDISSGTSREQALQTAGLDENTNLQCETNLSSTTTTPALAKNTIFQPVR